MTDPTAAAARLYSDLHSGFQLVAAVEAALPVSWLTLDLVALQRKPLPVVEEFTLRLCQQGVNTIPDIAAVLGVDNDVVQTAVAGQLSAETLDYRMVRQPEGPGVRTLRLTPAGVKAVTELETTTPQRVEQTNAFDRLQWVPAEYSKSELITRDQAKASGMVFLPSSRTHEVTAQDVTPRTLNTLFANTDKDVDPAPSRRLSASVQLDVLAVEAVTRQPRRYLPVVLLVFSALEFDEVRLSVVVDDLASDRHSDLLLQAGGADKLGITVAEPVGEPELPAHLRELRVSYETVRGLQKRADNTRPGASCTAPGDAAADDSVTARAELAALTVRSVPTFEHRELLAHALRDARRRFLLITPFVRDAVVDQDLIADLEVLLRRRGFLAHIAYGLGHPAREHDSEAINRLRKLAERYPNLTLVRLREAVPGCLIFDDTWINSSFDWLAYCGGPDRAYRREEGTLIRATDIVNNRYAEAVATLKSSLEVR
ncbi:MULTISPECIES: hypothetical protein [unclassified Crossiella]|uniref:hypothetical protein n=1 Tax=unclassified Crossiella TaxID=2620835 RepID=UPI001FFFB5D5|nr:MULTISPECIES: hypothetical protein [unclassified Crossiella]MCK2240986.1 hypothetical protein [Crossiella sp. S99.2]MCK2253870.1 hypothetical protein [Crossiella sp. S99.1]